MFTLETMQKSRKAGKSFAALGCDGLSPLIADGRPEIESLIMKILTPGISLSDFGAFRQPNFWGRKGGGI